MARPARNAVTGYTYYVIQRGNNRFPIFVDEREKRELLASNLQSITEESTNEEMGRTRSPSHRWS